MYSLPGPYSGHVDFDTSSNADSSCFHCNNQFIGRRTTSTDTANRRKSSSISTTATAATATARIVISTRTVSCRTSTYDTSSSIYGIRYE
jgi:hypothetical protein